MVETLAILAVVLLLLLQFVVPFTRYMARQGHTRHMARRHHARPTPSARGPLLQRAPATDNPPPLPRRPTARIPSPGQAPAESPEQLNQTFDLARIEGRVRLSSVRKVHAIVERHPGEVLHLLRHWMHKEA